MAPLSVLLPAAGPCDPVMMHRALARTALLFMQSASAGDELPIEEMIRVSASKEGYRPLLELR